MNQHPDRAAMASVLAKWLANTQKILDAEGEPNSNTAPLLEAARNRFEEIAESVLEERDRMLSERANLAPDWAEKIANMRMASQLSLLVLQLKATERFSVFPTRLMSAVDIMWYLAWDDRSLLNQVCRQETDRLGPEQRYHFRSEWDLFVNRLCKQLAAKHVTRCWDDETKAVSTWSTFRDEFIEAANREWELRRRQIQRTYWTDRILCLFRFSRT
jgi:hypothetical protein